MRFRIPTKILTLTICAAFLAPAAQGQDLILEEVFVTAQKREQTLEDVPLAVSTVSGETVNDYIGGAYDIRALAARVPGLNIETSNGRTQPRFYLRGHGNIDFDVNANQPVAMVFDEIYLENATLRSVPLFDLERVEVLKGPQGSLFGRNTNAGAIAITSVRPGEDRNAHIKLGYGSRNTFNLEGASNFVRSDTFSIRAAFKYQERGEWIDNVWNGPGDDFGGFEETAWRFQFAWDPSDSFSALLKLHGFHQEGSDPNVFYANAIASGDSGVRAGFNPRVANHDSEVAMMQTDHVGLALNMQWEMDSGKTFTSVTGYDEVDNFQSADVDGGELSFNPAQIGDPGIQHWFSVATGDGLLDHSQFTQEFRLAGDSEGFFYQVGFYYFDEDFDLLNYDYLDPGASALVTQATESYALFGQGEFQLSDQLSFTAGARWTDDSKDLAVGPYVSGGRVPPDTISVSDDFIDWDLSLSYDKNDDWTWYGRIATGARGPVTLARFGFTSKAKTETTDSYEVGFKSTLADGRARWNSAFYMYQNDDHQLVATGGVGNTNQLLNARQVNGMGFETELDWLVSENLFIHANLSYNDTEIDDPELRDDLCGSTPTCTPLDPIVGSRVGPFGPVTEVSIDGNPLPRSPEWIFNFLMEYTYPYNDGEVYFNTDWNYRGESSLFLHESVEYVQDARWLGGIRSGYRSGNGWDFAVVARNLTDEIVVEGGINFTNLTAFVNEPRYWGFETVYNF